MYLNELIPDVPLSNQQEELGEAPDDCPEAAEDENSGQTEQDQQLGDSNPPSNFLDEPNFSFCDCGCSSQFEPGVLPKIRSEYAKLPEHLRHLAVQGTQLICIQFAFFILAFYNFHLS